MASRTGVWMAAAAVVGAMAVGGRLFPETGFSQPSEGAGRTARFALVTGVRGNNANEQTVYILDEANELLFAFEYSALRKPDKNMELKGVTDLRRYVGRALKLRAEAEKERKEKEKAKRTQP